MNDSSQFPVPPGTAVFFERTAHFADFEVIEKGFNCKKLVDYHMIIKGFIALWAPA